VIKDTVGLNLGEFSDVFEGVLFDVWVGTWDWQAFRTHMDRLVEILEEEQDDIGAFSSGRIDAETFALRVQYRMPHLLLWLDKTWRNWTPEEIRQIWQHLSQICPLAFEWLVRRTWALILQYWTGREAEIIDRPGMMSTSWWRTEGMAKVAGAAVTWAEAQSCAVILDLPVRDERLARDDLDGPPHAGDGDLELRSWLLEIARTASWDDAP
jgi:hypothetical protein